MYKINDNFQKLPGSYLFSTIAKKVAAYQQTNPDKEIIKLVDWAKQNNAINFSLCNFLINHSWLDLQAMKDGKVNNITFDSFTDI